MREIEAMGRKPDRTLRVGRTVIHIIAPLSVADLEQKAIRETIVTAVARCLDETNKPADF